METIIQSKLNMPRLSQEAIVRPGLLCKLEAGAQHKLILVCAPAGFGKTLAVASWLQPAAQGELQEAHKPTAWYTIDAADNDPSAFLAYLLAAIQEVYPNSCATTTSCLEVAQLPPVDYIVSALLVDLIHLPGQLYLVLDDYHQITEPAIHQLLSGTVRHLPPQVHLVITSRTTPPLPLARLRASQGLTEINASDLSFSKHEAAALIATVLGRTPAPEVVEELVVQTSGWVAGLRLAATAMHSRSDDTAFVGEMRQRGHEYLFDYLLEEVLERLPDSLQQFLLKTSVLSDLTAGLCDAVLGAEHTSEAILSQLADDHLFVNRLDDRHDWYRYHPQFRLLLQNRLRVAVGDGEVARLQHRAAEWYAKNGYFHEGMRAYLAASDAESAASCLEDCLETIYRQDHPQQLHIIERLLSLLPSALVEQRPLLLMSKAWVLQWRGRYEAIGVLVERVEALLVKGHGPTDAERLQALQGEIYAAKTYAYMLSGKLDAQMESAQQALRYLPPTRPLARGMVLLLLSRCYRWCGRSGDALRLLEGVLQSTDMAPNSLTIAALNALAQHSMYSAQPQKTEKVAEVARSLSHVSGYLLNEGVAHTMLGVVACQTDQDEKVRRHFAYVRDNPYLVQFNSQLGMIYYCTWYVAVRGGEAQMAEVLEVIERLRAVAWEVGNVESQPVVDALEAHAALRTGNLAAVRRWVESVSLPPIHPVSPIVRAVWVRCLLAMGDAPSLALAQQGAEELLAHCQARNDLMIVVEAQVLLSLIYQAQGKEAQAVALLAEAVSFGVPRGFRLNYMGYGAPMRRLLERIALDTQHDQPRADAARLLLAILPIEEAATDLLAAATPAGYTLDGPRESEPDGIPTEQLTNREIEVLELLALKLSNREIADQLFVSPNTVRNHIVHLCQKLGVNNRRAAVLRARQLSLIAPR